MILSRIQQRILLSQCMAGKRHAQKKLYDIYANEMFKVCLVYAKDYDSANDLLQEGFLKVFQNLHKFKNSGSLGGWMRTVIVNNCIDAYRADKWNRNKVLLNEEFNVHEKIIAINGAEKKFEREDFLVIIKSLPEGYKLVLNLYFLEDLGHKEIAEKLQISEGTSKSQLYKAKKHLKEILVGTLSDEELKKYGYQDKRVV